MEIPNEYLNQTSNLDDTTALKTLQKELDDAISDEVEQLYRTIDTVNKGYIADLNTNIVARYKIDDVQSGS